MLPDTWRGFFDGADQSPVQTPKSEVINRSGQLSKTSKRSGGPAAAGQPGERQSLEGTHRSLLGILNPGADEPPDHVYRERVLVRVYDLGTTYVTRGMLNRVAKNYGAFHTGVEVYGREWSFGMTFDDYSTGVTWNPPGQNHDHTFRETLSMGYTTLSPGQVLKLIEIMEVEWKGCTYHLLSRNCHNFSDEFCRRLGVCGLPDWVNTLASTGADTAEWVDSADSGYDGGEALFDFFRSVRTSFGNFFSFSDTEQQYANRHRYGYGDDFDAAQARPHHPNAPDWEIPPLPTWHDQGYGQSPSAALESRSGDPRRGWQRGQQQQQLNQPRRF